MKLRRLILLIVLSIFIYTDDAYSVCRGTLFNPIKDVNWNGVFPISIAGVTVKGPDNPLPDTIDPVICKCKKGPVTIVGISVSFWEPANIIETVHDPFCFLILGLSIPKIFNTLKTDVTLPNAINAGNLVSFNAHWYKFNIWRLLSLFTNLPCISEFDGFDVGYATEPDFFWNDDYLSIVLFPETLLFGNPYALVSCIPDAITAGFGFPLNPLFWCMGGWGGTYPVSRNSYTTHSMPVASAHIAGRMLYKMGRLLLLWDSAKSQCGATITPIWIKSHYKMHTMKPVRSQIIPIGKVGILWETGKNPIPLGTVKGSADNFAWMLFKKVRCCVGIPLPG